MDTNKIYFTNSGPNLNEEGIRDIELKYNFQFPIEYRNFLLKINGGIPSKMFYVNNQLGYSYVIDLFLSIKPGKLSFQEYFEDYKIIQKLIPDDMVPIAEDAFGNLVCISAGLTNNGAIYFWNHEFSDESMRMIAPSLNIFLNSLKENNEE